MARPEGVLVQSLRVHDSLWEEQEAPARSAAPPAPRAFTVQPPLSPARYGTQRFSWPAATVALAFNGVLLMAMVNMNLSPPTIPKAAPMVVDLLQLPKEPPPTEPPPSDTRIGPVKIIEPVAVAPRPIVPPPVQPVRIAAVPEPPPVRTAIIAPPQAKPAPTGPVSAPDLSTTMVSAKPPRYPVESRKQREQGTVVLNVLVGLSGAVSEIAVSRSSGFPRLDRAALEAVRRWKWSPTLRSGQPVMVRGFVDIPFVLQG